MKTYVLLTLAVLATAEPSFDKTEKVLIISDSQKIKLPSFAQTIAGSGKSISVNLADKFTADTCKSDNDQETERRDLTGSFDICLASTSSDGYVSGGNLSSAGLSKSTETTKTLPEDKELGLNSLPVTYKTRTLVLKFTGGTSEEDNGQWSTTITVDCDIEAKTPYVSKTSIKSPTAAMTIHARELCEIDDKTMQQLQQRESVQDEYFSKIPSSGYTAVLSIATLLVSAIICFF